jgi:hypothetical protein
MTCNCPKCRADVDVDVSDVTEEGTTAPCPSCSVRFSLHRENFAGRAFRRTGEISCANCGSLLGPQIHCEKCGRPFPDYVVAALNRKKAGPAIPEYRAKISLFQKKKKRTPSYAPDLSKKAASPDKKPLSARDWQRNKTIVATVVILVAAAVIGGMFYVKKQAEAAYAKNFCLACYSIQLTADKSQKACQKVAAEWKAKNDAGQTYVPRISIQDETDLKKIAGKLAPLTAKLAKEPGKFKGCNEQLAKLEAPAAKMRALALAPGNSLPTLTDSTNKLDAEYRTAASHFKAALPPELMDELRASAQMYKGLRPLLQ